MTEASNSADIFGRGAAIRSSVMGADHVARSGGLSPEEATPLQTYVTEFGWGTVWAREGLPMATKSLVTVSMLIALNRPHELAGHMRGALNNGCTVEELRNTVVHASVYCGFPAALDAMRTLDGVIAARANTEA